MTREELRQKHGRRQGVAKGALAALSPMSCTRQDKILPTLMYVVGQLRARPSLFHASSFPRTRSARTCTKRAEPLLKGKIRVTFSSFALLILLLLGQHE